MMLIVLAIGGFLTVAGTIAVVVGGAGLAITKAISAFKMLKAGFLLVKGALTPLIGSVWSFTAALLANPVTWVVIGIAALIAAIVLLYNKCEWFRNLVNNILNFFKEKADLMPFVNVEMTFFPESKNQETAPVIVLLTLLSPAVKAAFTLSNRSRTPEAMFTTPETNLSLIAVSFPPVRLSRKEKPAV